MLDNENEIERMTNNGNGQQVGIGTIKNIDTNITNINNNSSEYAAKYERYKELQRKKRYEWYTWSWDKDQPEFDALKDYLRKNAN